MNIRTVDNIEQYKITDRFDSSYWSGIEMSLYLGKILVEEAFQFNYQIMERVVPYWGYASYSADRIFHGNRVISGEFSINFKRDSLIFSMLEDIRRTGGSYTTAPIKKEKPNLNPNPTLPYLFDAGLLAGTFAERMLTTDGDGMFASPEVIAAARDSFKAQYFKDEESIRGIEPVLNRKAGLFETSSKGFTLSLIFGADFKDGLTVKYDTDNIYTRDQILPMDNSTQINPSTGIQFIGVELMGVARSVTDDGRNIVETFTFQAKDINLLSHEQIVNGDTEIPNQQSVKPTKLK